MENRNSDPKIEISWFRIHAREVKTCNEFLTGNYCKFPEVRTPIS